MIEEMASESVRAMKEKIASDNLFKAKAVGETQVRPLHSYQIVGLTRRPRRTHSSVVGANNENAPTIRCKPAVQMSR